DILPPVRPLIGDRRVLDGSGNLGLPYLLTRGGLEGAEAVVIGGADKGQAAGGGESATAAGPAGVLILRRQLVGHPDALVINRFARVHVDGDQFTPGCRAAEQVMLVSTETAQARQRAL